MSDSAHLNSPSKPTVRLPATQQQGEPIEDQFDTPTALLRLLLGAALVGADELRVRLRAWEAATRSSAQAASHPMASPSTVRAPRRYALIGMLFDSRTRVRREISRVRVRLERLSDQADSYYDEMHASDMRQTPIYPLLERLDELFFNAEEMVDRWAARGKSEAERGSRMARFASTSVVDELLDYMARNPEVRKLIEQQASGMAEVAVDEVRERAESADEWVERLAHRVLRRPVSEVRPEVAGVVELPPLQGEARTGAPSNPQQTRPPTRGARAPQGAANVESPQTDGSHDGSDG